MMGMNFRLTINEAGDDGGGGGHAGAREGRGRDTNWLPCATGPDEDAYMCLHVSSSSYDTHVPT